MIPGTPYIAYVRATSEVGDAKATRVSFLFDDVCFGLFVYMGFTVQCWVYRLCKVHWVQGVAFRVQASWVNSRLETLDPRRV